MARHVRADVHANLWRRLQLEMRVKISDAMDAEQRGTSFVRQCSQLVARQIAMAVLNLAKLVEDFGPGALHSVEFDYRIGGLGRVLVFSYLVSAALFAADPPKFTGPGSCAA